MQHIAVLIAALGVATLLACAASPGPVPGAPVKMDDGWSTAAPAAVGLDPGPLAAMVDRVRDGTFPEVDGILIVRHGKLVFERYFPGYAWDYRAKDFRGPWTEYGPDTAHNLASVTKSVTAILLAIAVDRGMIRGFDEPLCGFFPGYTSLCTGGKERITLAHVLSMTSGLSWNEQDVPYSQQENDIVQLFLVPDPVAHVLSKPIAYDPASHWYYNGGGTNLLGEVIQRASGLRLDGFAQRFLFSPLHITGHKWVFIQPDFVYASGDMTMRPRDMAKLGHLLLGGGVWGEERVLSPELARALVQRRVQLMPNSGYGFHWWTRTYEASSAHVDAFYADGWGGQRIMVFPERDLVVVFTGSSYTKGHHLDDVVTGFILPSLTTPD